MVQKVANGQAQQYVKQFWRNYSKPQDLVAEELFFDQVCRKTRDKDGNQTYLLDKAGHRIFYQIDYFLNSEIDILNEDQKQLLLTDPRYLDPITGKTKIFPYKTLLSITRTLTEADNNEWLKARWSWEGLKRDK
jgi:hypothetical protein